MAKTSAIRGRRENPKATYVDYVAGCMKANREYQLQIKKLDEAIKYQPNSAYEKSRRNLVTIALNKLMAAEKVPHMEPIPRAQLEAWLSYARQEA
jgi:hypothetical protein